MFLPYSFLPSLYNIKEYANNPYDLANIANFLWNLANMEAPVLLCKSKEEIVNSFDVSNLQGIGAAKEIIKNAIKKIITSKKYIELDLDKNFVCNNQQNCKFTVECNNIYLDNKTNHVLIGHNECMYSENDKILLLDNYLNSDFYRKSVNPQICFRTTGMLDDLKSIFISIFRFANRIIIYDRYIGECVLNHQNGFSNFEKQYKNSLNFLADIIENHAINNPKVYIIGAIKTQTLSTIGVQQLHTEFKNYVSTIKCNNFSLEFILKEVQRINDVEHNRYLIIDNKAISSSNGLDFLNSNNSIAKDIELNFAQIKQEVLNLININNFKDFCRFKN